jgi:ATP-dependent Clp protease adaptor protein ClpS
MDGRWRLSIHRSVRTDLPKSRDFTYLRPGGFRPISLNNSDDEAVRVLTGCTNPATLARWFKRFALVESGFEYAKMPGFASHNGSRAVDRSQMGNFKRHAMSQLPGHFGTSVVDFPAASSLHMSGDENRTGGPSSPGVSVITKVKPRTKRPSLYRVLILNDDYTPMEFVVHVLERFFNKDVEAATKIMLHVHHHGIGECGIFTYEIAETKVTQVMDFARKHQHPLQCVMEKK